MYNCLKDAILTKMLIRGIIDASEGKSRANAGKLLDDKDLKNPQAKACILSQL